VKQEQPLANTYEDLEKEDGPLQILINGKAQEILSECTIFQLLSDKNVNLKSAVVELNGKILKQELWQSTAISAGDSLEILIFMGGG
jgi:thiamine biosynthesis protein ThiS